MNPAGEGEGFTKERALVEAQDLPGNPRIVRYDLKRLDAMPQVGEGPAKDGREELLGEEGSPGAAGLDGQVPLEVLAEEFRRIGLQRNGSERTFPQVELRVESGEAEVEELPPASGAVQD